MSGILPDLVGLNSGIFSQHPSMESGSSNYLLREGDRPHLITLLLISSHS